MKITNQLIISFIVFSNMAMANVKHFVAFKFKPEVTSLQKQQIQKKFMLLKDECLKDGKKYILSIESGPVISKEGFDQKFEQGYIVTFKSLADKDYYVGKPFSSSFDPAHENFKSFVGPLLQTDANNNINGVFVFDFNY